MNTTNKQDIKNHLRNFGIRHFESDAEYWNWGAKQLGPKHAERVDSLRQPVTEGANKEQLKRFYDYIAKPDVSGVIHSLKADAIAASGAEIDARLPRAGRILDLGCSTGHLTILYGLRHTQCDVLGCDFSEKSIILARKEAKNRKANNVSFAVADIDIDLPAGEFDVVASTQTLAWLDNRRGALKNIHRKLSKNGVLISIEALGTAEQADSYLADAATAGLLLDAFQFVHFSDRGEHGAYPAFILKPGGQAKNIDLSERYTELLKKLDAMRSIDRD